MAASAPSTRQTTPEFITSEGVGDLIAALLEQGVTAFEQQAEQRGTGAIDAAAVRAGKRAVSQLRAYHGGGAQ